MAGDRPKVNDTSRETRRRLTVRHRLLTPATSRSRPSKSPTLVTSQGGAMTEIRDAVLVASGDLRETANRLGWPAQRTLEGHVGDAFARHGVKVQRAHALDPGTGHGFISSQRMGMDVFAGIDRDAPLIVAEAVWQYSHHVLPGLRRHRGPILTVANWDGTWPGLVGMLNINASLTKMGRSYSTIWGEDLTDDF